MTRNDRWAILLLIAIGVGVPLVLGALSGALVVSHNDDFNYRRVALGLYETGQIELTSWTVMSLIGQLALVQPFLWIAGGNAWAFAAMTAVLAVIGIGASYVLVRQILPAGRSFVTVFLVIVFPGFLLNTTSFMTDVPAYAGEIVCLALGTAALQRKGPSRWRWLIASLAVGCFAFSIREFALAAPVAVLAAATASATGSRTRYIAAGAILLAACGAIYLITSNLPGQGTAVLAPLSANNIQRTLMALTTLAFGLSPAILIGAAWWLPRVHIPETLAGALVGVLLTSGSLLAIAGGDGIPAQFVGNLLVVEGAPGAGALAGDRPILFEAPWWDVMNAVALISTILGMAILGGAVGLAIRRPPLANRDALSRSLGSVTGLLVVFVVVFAGGLVAFGLIASMFDRYLWPLALPLAAFLMLEPGWAAETTGHRWRMPRAVATVAAGIATIVIAVSAFVLLLNSVAFDAARWRIGEEAVRAGFAAETIDAGMEWVGYHATGTATINAAPSATEMWYSAWWPSFHQCAIVSGSLLDIPGFRLERAELSAYRLLFVAGPEAPLYLYSVDDPGCPSG